MALPSAVPDSPSALKLLVLFFLRCFLRLACGEGGGSIFGLVVLEMLGLEQTESPRPVSERRSMHQVSHRGRGERIPSTAKAPEGLSHQRRSQDNLDFSNTAP